MDSNLDKPKNGTRSTNSTIMTSQNNLSINGSNKFKIKEASKKENNVISFIKEKNKFYLNNLFDQKGSNQFLAEKEKALMEIELNEQITIITKNNKKDKSHKKKHVKYNSEIKIYEENKELREKCKHIIEKTSICSNKKKSPKKIKKSKTSNKKNLINELKTDDNSDLDNSQENNENFNKKLNKKGEENNQEIFKSNTAKIKMKRSRSPKNKHHKKKNNPFNFSEIAKNLMMNEDIEVSSINDDTSSLHKNQSIIKETTSDSNKSESKKEKIDNNKELSIDSDKKVFLNILFEFK